MYSCVCIFSGFDDCVGDDCITKHEFSKYVLCRELFMSGPEQFARIFDTGDIYCILDMGVEFNL